ncbi:LPS export ABC transporter periplasmic protein LptC [Parasphingorhabdus sp. DH2-15]|uniref:LPS export ABC transporter periplasmic protein LptC n=1 Tax=Parasphingorhabdus sp. DH2-15 TaxID=3444112 RepID=UPI003F6867B4
MTEIAQQRRTQRQDFAAPDGNHDRMIRFLRGALPAAIGSLFAFLVLAPLLQRSELSFLLDKDTVEIAPEAMRVADAIYRGKDSRERPFTLQAGEAIQRSSDIPIVELSELTARLLFESGPGELRADQGEYDIEGEQVEIIGPVLFESENGYRLVTRDVDLDLRERSLKSRGRVNGRTPMGTFEADSLRSDLEARTVTLEGNAKLRIEQGRLR